MILAPTPKIKNILNIHEPTRFPTAKSVSFFNTAIIDVTSSGIAVPIAIIVNPITLSGTFNCSAIFVALSTTKSPPYFNNITPTIKINIDLNRLILDVFSLSSLIVFTIPFISFIIGYKKYN